MWMQYKKFFRLYPYIFHVNAFTHARHVDGRQRWARETLLDSMQKIIVLSIYSHFPPIEYSKTLQKAIECQFFFGMNWQMNIVQSAHFVVQCSYSIIYHCKMFTAQYMVLLRSSVFNWIWSEVNDNYHISCCLGLVQSNLQQSWQTIFFAHGMSKNETDGDKCAYRF